MNDDKPGVTGVGGIFFKTSDPEKMKHWYSEHLGFDTDEYGTMFEFRLADEPEKTGYLQWSPFPVDTKYFDPTEKEFMVNYRVNHLEQLVENLQQAGIEIVGEIQEYEYGKFAHIMDPDGNKVELWEPVDEAFE
ncbi:MAG: VOC family protein [Candidatus Marinimicrobia bacterium]|nr:VOC family protein [Candidatus Neomarinimicrobiota bacterium]MCF7827556.1 VOC family protein [Candidatus Neomarinimicrobiota bacterium]MCF7881582.1 VOC family protein [Candidatus Neomarinimicrobiota bacterium]